jgi:hypothetical protein
VKEVIETMLIATADEILWKGLEMGGFDPSIVGDSKV